MVWLRKDDTYLDHPKILALSDGAYRLADRGLLWCARHLTDGHIPATVVPTLCPKRATKRARLCAELVTAGLWEAHQDGSYVIHDFLHYNPSAAEVRERQDARARAGLQGGQASVAARRVKYGTGQPRPEAKPEARASGRSEANASATVRPPDPTRPERKDSPPTPPAGDTRPRRPTTPGDGIGSSVDDGTGGRPGQAPDYPGWGDRMAKERMAEEKSMADQAAHGQPTPEAEP